MGELWEVEVAPDPHSGEKTHQPTTTKPVINIG